MLSLPGDALACPMAPRSEQSVHDEESGAGPADHVDEPRHRLQHESDARDPQCDEEGIGCRADRRDDEDVLAPETLAQHEKVLRADRDDEREAEAEAREDGGEHTSTLGRAAASVQLTILQVH